MMLRQLLFSATLLLGARGLSAQDQPAFGAYQFSNGVHPTVDAVFEAASAREVERFWQGELKGISVKVTNKKELVGHAARVPAASPDTLQILVAVEKPKGSLYTTAHIAFFTTAGYVGPDSPERERDGTVEWVRQRTAVLRRQLAQAEVDRQQRQLDNLNRDLNMLQREQQRAENNIRRSQERMEQAARDSATAAQGLANLDASPLAAQDSSDLAAAGKAKEKERSKLQAQVKRAAYNRASYQKRIGDLQWDLKKNADGQKTKQAAIEQQQSAVNTARGKLQSIR
ncbi:MAG: hypothetical protein JST45_03800 [Bacteroidetes bacterium]|nr:hypothetical protein [Bacteroidota bacterium]